MPKLAVVDRPLSELKPHARNARTHSDAQVAALARSIEEFGWTKPVLVDGSGVIIAGHGACLAAKRLRLATVPTIELSHLTAAQRRAYMLADNRLAEASGWDDGLLRLEVAELTVEGFDLSIAGFEPDELAGLKRKPRDAKTEPDAQPPAGPPVARAGDLWLMGEHRLYVGDTFNADDRALLLPGGMLGDCVVTDPPYAIYGSSTGIGADISDDKMVRPFFEAMARALANSVREFAHIYACCDWRSYATLWGGFKEARLSPKNCVVWDKGSAGLGNSYANTHEFVAFFARLPPQKAMQSNARRGQRPVHRPNIFRCNRVTGEERQHNAAKPVALLTFLIENSTDEGELVLDLFAGSGSTLIACQATGRRCAAMEIEPRYADTTVRRWQAFTGLQAHLGTPDGPTLSEIAVSRKGG